MLRRVHDPERGASLLEHTAVLVLVAALVGGVALAIPTSTVTTAVEDAVERILGEEGAGTDLAEGTPSDGAAEPTTPGQDGPEPGGQEEGADSPATDEPSAGEDPPVGGVGEQAAPPGDDRGFWDHAGEFFTDGAWGGVVDDATEMWDSVTDPVGAVVDAWNGFTTYFGEAHQRAQDSGQQARQQWAEGDYFGAAWTLISDTAQESLWEAPWSAGGLVRSIADENVVEAWQNGDYGEALGRGVWNAGQWFIPYAGWANRINNMLPDAPSPGRGDNGVPTQQRADDDDPNVAAACPRGSSFLPGTPVLLADGTYTPIETIDVGDEVWAFDPLTGEEGPRQVTDLITSTGEKTLVQLTLTDPSGATDTLTATDNHPFWAPEHAQWVQAIDLQPGTWLRTSTGTWTQVTAIEAWTAPHQRVHNLTVTGIHTYYVGTAAGDALVHNQNNCWRQQGGPGQWEQVNEGMSTRSAEYQERVTGVPQGNGYVVNGVKFDGYDNGVLLDAKGPGYATHVSNGQFKPYFGGANSLVEQARRQSSVAGGTPIRWLVQEREAAEAIRNLFTDAGITGVEVVHSP